MRNIIFYKQVVSKKYNFNLLTYVYVNYVLYYIFSSLTALVNVFTYFVRKHRVN